MTQLMLVAQAVAMILEAPRDRLGRLEFFTDEARASREALRFHAVQYGVESGMDVLQQAGNVLRAALAEVRS